MENKIRDKKGKFIKGHLWIGKRGFKSIANSLAKMQEKNPMWGKHISEKQKQAIREANWKRKREGKYGHSIETRKKLSKINKGKHFSPSTEFKSKSKNRISADERQKIRGSLEYRLWQVAVYKRDDYICRICGRKCLSKQIVAHHILSFNDYPELRFAINNGMTLCRSCHIKIHK